MALQDHRGSLGSQYEVDPGNGVALPPPPVGGMFGIIAAALPPLGGAIVGDVTDEVDAIFVEGVDALIVMGSFDGDVVDENEAVIDAALPAIGGTIEGLLGDDPVDARMEEGTDASITMGLAILEPPEAVVDAVLPAIGGGMTGAVGVAPFFVFNPANWPTVEDMLADVGAGNYWQGFTNEELITREAVTPPAGRPDITHAARYHFPDDGGADYGIGMKTNFLGSRTEFWSEVWQGCSTSFTTDGPEPAGEDYKDIFWNHRFEGEENGRSELKFKDTNVSTGGTEFALVWPTAEPSVHCVSEDDSPGNGVVWDGTITGFRVHHKIGQGDGIIELWIYLAGASGWQKLLQGEEVVPVLNNVVFGDVDELCSYLTIGANMNQGTGRTMEIDQCLIEIFDVDPGW